MSNKAPGVIYLQTNDPQITWCADRIDETDTRYIRSDMVVHLMDKALAPIIEIVKKAAKESCSARSALENIERHVCPELTTKVYQGEAARDE